MELVNKPPTAKAPPETFTGDAWIDPIVRGEGDSHIRVSVVRFAPGARNAWHAHARGQTFHVTEGRGLTQAAEGPVVEVRAGDTVHADPGEWHWHGAAPDHFMTHIAIWESPGEGEETHWGALVTDEEYFAGH